MRIVKRWLVRGVLFCLSMLGLVVLVGGAMIAAPLSRPPKLDSIEKTASAVDRTGMPDIGRFQARDGSDLAYRFYPAAAPRSDRIAVLCHGSSASSAAMHALARSLAARGVATYALDIRGHGHSGTRGDIGYIGQLEDDLADTVAMIRRSAPRAPLVLIGHSSGGGFALRIAGSPLQGLFAKTILLAPYLGFRAPTSRPDAGGWARADLPRAIAITILERFGITGLEALQTVAFAVPPNLKAILTDTYTFRLMTNYGVHRDYRDDLAATTGPVSVFVGAADELMVADRYTGAMNGSGRTVPVHILPGLDHMAVVSDASATDAIAKETLAGPES